MKKLLALVLAAIMCFAVVGCTEDRDEVHNISAYGYAFIGRDSKITIESIDPAETWMDGERAVFKPSISAKDITLSDALEGKKVKSVKFINQYEIEIELTGSVKSIKESSEDGKLVISANALENNDDAVTWITVRKARIHTGGHYYAKGSGTYRVTYDLDAGSFSENASMAQVRLADGSDGSITSVSVSNNRLTVEVVGASKEPTLILDASISDWNRQITIPMSDHAEIYLE